MKTSSYSRPEYVECDHGLIAPDQVVVTKVEILHADREEMDDRWDDVASSGLDVQMEPDWKDSQASLASSEIYVHRESWRDIVSPTIEVETKPECSSEISVYRDIVSPTIEVETKPECSSEISVYRDIVSPTIEVETKPEFWKDSQVSLASSEVSVQQGREGQDERWSDTLTSPPSSDVSVTRDARERWSDCRSPPDDVETTDSAVPQEPSEMYYTASSEVSLLSDTEVPDKAEDKGEKECVIAGHVAAMRERFESMTRANTPCPDLMRSSSPSLDVFRNITPSPDRLG